MKRYEASPATLSRFRVLCLVMLGVFALMLAQLAQDVFVLHLTAPQGQTGTVLYALTWTEIGGILFAGGIALRFVRTGKLPGVVSLLALLALTWAVALLGHYS